MKAGFVKSAINLSKRRPDFEICSSFLQNDRPFAEMERHPAVIVHPGALRMELLWI